MPVRLPAPSSRRALAGVLSAVVLVGALAGCATEQEAALGAAGGGSDAGEGLGYISGSGSLTSVPAAEREQPAAVSGTTLDDEPLDVADLRGDVVVLNFWASWCPPCRAEAAALESVAETTAGNGVEFVGVNVKDKRSSAIAFERAQETPYPSLYDQPGRVALAFRGVLPPNALPSTLVLDREGRVAARFLGAVTSEQLLPVVQAVADEAEPSSALPPASATSSTGAA